jgi:membrane-bound serine protease (ClpP class)
MCEIDTFGCPDKIHETMLLSRFNRIRVVLKIIFCLVLCASASFLSASQNHVAAVRVAGAINPVVASFVADEIDKANTSGAAAFLVELDTPGGLDTAMRDIVQSILSSYIPVIVYVSPAGARAASAGAFITLSADFAAMAPGTNIGAATPVSISGEDAGGKNNKSMQDKVINDAIAYARSIAEQRGRNVEWAEKIVSHSISTAASEALELKVIDLIASSRSDLLAQLDGARYLRNGQSQTLELAGVEVRFTEMNWRQKILDTISNPNVAYLLMMLGIIGIFFEISQPGVILPGAIGAIAILLALFAFQSLPINYAGVLLILLGLVLFILEVKVVSYGMLSVGGVVSLALGSLMLIDSPEPYLQISKGVIISTVLVFAGFFVLCLMFIVRTQRQRFKAGSEGMSGELGKAITAVNSQGTVFVHGEYWAAFSRAPIEPGSTIEVVGLTPQMKLEVRGVAGTTTSKPIEENLAPDRDNGQ